MHLFNLSLYRLVAVIQLKVHFKENASSKRTMDFEPSIGLETNIYTIKAGSFFIITLGASPFLVFPYISKIKKG